MKTILLTFILSIFTIAHSFAINTNSEEECDILKLTDGRIVEVHIIRQTDTNIYFADCGDKSMTERSLQMTFVDKLVKTERNIVQEELLPELKNQCSDDKEYSNSSNKRSNYIRTIIKTVAVIGIVRFITIVSSIAINYQEIMNIKHLLDFLSII